MRQVTHAHTHTHARQTHMFIHVSLPHTAQVSAFPSAHRCSPAGCVVVRLIVVRGLVVALGRRDELVQVWLCIACSVCLCRCAPDPSHVADIQVRDLIKKIEHATERNSKSNSVWFTGCKCVRFRSQVPVVLCMATFVHTQHHSSMQPEGVNN